jgi:hypothetical protein
VLGSGKQRQPGEDLDEQLVDQFHGHKHRSCGTDTYYRKHPAQKLRTAILARYRIYDALAMLSYRE